MERHVVVMGGWAPSLVRFRKPLLRQLVARGHRVTAIAADGTPALERQLGEMGVAYREMALARATIDPIADLALLARLTACLRILRPDVLFTYTIKPVVYGNLAAAMARVPARHAMITGLGYSFGGQHDARRRWLRRTVALLYRAALHGADGLFLQNPDDQVDLAAASALPPRLPITFVRGSGVDLDHFAQAPFLPGPPRFVFVGRLLREKGILEFVELARRVRARHPEVRFEVIGGVDPNPASIAAAAVDGWVRDGLIEYAGEVAEVRPGLARAHVLVLPSYREGTPRSVLEAMSTGRPVIVTDVPGCRETIVDGQQGFLVPDRDPAALERAATRLIEDRELVVTMGARARARACALYDAQLVASRMLEVMGL